MADSDQLTPEETGQDVAVLDHALWSKLENSDDLEDYAAAWLALMCQRIPGTSRAVLILKSRQHGQLEPVAYWPKGRAATAGLSSAAETALREGRGVAQAAKPGEGRAGRAPDVVNVAQPVRVDGEPVGIVAVEIANRSKERLAVVMRDLQWGTAWITAAFRNRETQADRSGQARLQLAIELFAATLGQRSFVEASRTLATELATELDCDRVTVTRRRRKLSRAVALSHSASFDRRTKLMRAIERATDEAIDQWHTVRFPAGEKDGAVRRAQEAVFALNGGLATLATPLPVDNRVFGGLFLERAADRPFTEEDAHFVESLAALAGPALNDKWVSDRGLLVTILVWVRDVLARTFGPRHLTRKIVLLLLAGVIAASVLITRPYRVTADARLSGVIERAVTVPFDGYLGEANARAGDVVPEGAVLARLDTRDLEIERLRVLSERTQNAAEYDRALGESDRVGLNVIRTRIEQADAQIALLEAQIARTALLAPFEGVVISGDLSQRLGDAVARGEVLYEIAPLDDYTVEVLVDERDIDQVAPGQPGWLALSAFPEAPVEIRVSQVLPVSSQKDGLNYFQVDAELVDGLAREKLRPGMEGVAKIDIAERRLIWIWTHRIVDWARMFAWRWTY